MNTKNFLKILAKYGLKYADTKDIEEIIKTSGFYVIRWQQPKSKIKIERLLKNFSAFEVVNREKFKHHIQFEQSYDNYPSVFYDYLRIDYNKETDRYEIAMPVVELKEELIKMTNEEKKELLTAIVDEEEKEKWLLKAIFEPEQYKKILFYRMMDEYLKLNKTFEQKDPFSRFKQEIQTEFIALCEQYVKQQKQEMNI